MPHNRENATLKVENCTFTGEVASDYAIFVQGPNGGTMSNVVLSGNNISGYRCGVNVQAGTSATVSITGNTITNLTGKDANGGKYGSAIQLTSGASFTVTDNTINTKNVNAFHLYNGLNAAVTISNNNIKAPYLLWNEANLDQSKITSSGNTLDIANRDKAMTKTGAIDSTTTINGTVVEHPIVIITPTGDTPKTEPEKNPATGANDVVAAAVALMAVSALGAAVLTRKK